MATDIDGVVDWIIEREAIRHRREAGQDWPWSSDEIFQTWSFCNVRREADRTTRWLTKHWRKPNADDPDLWFAMTVARRCLNDTDTLGQLGYAVPWRPKHFLNVIEARQKRGLRVYNSAYQIGTAAQRVPKPEFLANLLEALWREREFVRPRKKDSLASIAARLMGFKGLGGFFVAQTIADLKYAQLLEAKDWDTFALSGPGSRRGLNRVLGLPVNSRMAEARWHEELLAVRERVNRRIAREGIEKLHAQDFQSALCEFDKYERVRLGEGTPKRRYARPMEGVLF